jgi:hypothetical protein
MASLSTTIDNSSVMNTSEDTSYNFIIFII